MPLETSSVSPCFTVTSFIGMPICSAISIAHDVSCPCPWAELPV
jgi:hypothetical protein